MTYYVKILLLIMIDNVLQNSRKDTFTEIQNNKNVYFSKSY